MLSLVSFLSSVCGFVSNIYSFLTGWMQVRKGKQIQVQADTVETLKTVERERQADVNAPLTGDAAIKRLEDGTA